MTAVLFSGCSEKPAEKTIVSENAITDAAAKVYMIIPNGAIARYLKFDAPNVEKWLKEYAPNMTLQVLDSEGNAQRQIQQVEGAIADGAKAVILLPVDSNTAGGMLSALREEGILTLTYAHEGFGGPVDYHITAPFTTIAKGHAEYLEAYMREHSLGRPYNLAELWGQPGFAFYEDLKSVWDPYVKKWEEEGLVRKVYEADTNGWTSEASHPVAEQCLTQAENNIDVIITMNDDLGSGIIAALNSQGLAGKVLLSGGCDATLEGIARVQAGWQLADICPDYSKTAEAAAKIIAYRLGGKEVPSGIVNGTFDNKFVEGGVPAVYVDMLIVLKENINDLIVKPGMYTQKQIDDAAAGMK
jgi:D-xylose transport system substrate-binding protein